MRKSIDSRFSWGSRFNIGLHSDCLSDIFLQNKIVRLNSRAIVPFQASFSLRFSYSTNVTCGAYLVGAEEVSHRMGSPCEAKKRAVPGESLKLCILL
mgnify:CR=1 FL=1